MLRVVRFVLAAWLPLVSCVDHDLVICGDGRACPVGTICDDSNATCVADGTVGLSASEIELLDVTCGTSAMRTIVVTNPGRDEIAVTARVTPSDLVIAPADAVIPAGGAVELTLTLDAGSTTMPGDVNVGALTIETP